MLRVPLEPRVVLNVEMLRRDRQPGSLRSIPGDRALTGRAPDERIAARSNHLFTVV
ncbi:MAG: hypothetical protein MZU95_00485 [Desulfomicrobium escambiense]|nr:hypothetical protein [Desulfomicrobium escambiense]